MINTTETAQTATMQQPPAASIGIDLGGTKIEGIALTGDGRTLAKIRIPTPREDYEATLAAIARLAAEVEQQAGAGDGLPVGIGMPGSISPASGRVQNANSTWLNGRLLASDLAARLQRPLRLANDANCFALSEYEDGAGMGAATLFGVILGTGCGGGIIIGGRLADGPRGIGGEWGHNPLPWADGDEVPGPQCWCGLRGCLETWISGPGLAADHFRMAGERFTAEQIVARSSGSMATDVMQQAAKATLVRHASRLARGLAHVVNLIDPDVIVLGGGLSNLAHLYRDVPDLMRPFIFADDRRVEIRPPRHGDASGARGAARLWRDVVAPK